MSRDQKCKNNLTVCCCMVNFEWVLVGKVGAEWGPPLLFPPNFRVLRLWVAGVPLGWMGGISWPRLFSKMAWDCMGANRGGIMTLQISDSWSSSLLDNAPPPFSLLFLKVSISFQLDIKGCGKGGILWFGSEKWWYIL